MRDKNAITYKLPAEFMTRHGEFIRAWPWDQAPVLALKDAFPDIAALQHVRLELVGIGSERIVRPQGGGSAIKLRRYAGTLPRERKPTSEEIAAVLAKRNKPKEQQE